MPKRSNPPPDLIPRHPVRVAATRTGLTTHLLRAWERRYGVVAPTRTAGGQRLYSDADIARLTLLGSLTAEGGSIAQLARLSQAELERQAARRPDRQSPLGTPPDAAGWRANALDAIEAGDGPALRRVLRAGIAELGVGRSLDELLGPLLVEIGERWHAGRLTIALEHQATAVVRGVLAWARELTEAESPSAPVLVVATPPGQVHEGGALLAAAAAASAGWRIVYLGADLPVAEIAAAARRSGARAVALSLVHPPNDPSLRSELRRLGSTLSPGVVLLLGGRASPSYLDAIAASGGQLVADLPSLRAALTSLERSNH